MMLSLAMACRRRGAPVSDWRPAPHVEKNEPITMTQGEGQASVPTTRFPFTESPNLPGNTDHTEESHGPIIRLRNHQPQIFICMDFDL